MIDWHAVVDKSTETLLDDLRRIGDDLDDWITIGSRRQVLTEYLGFVATVWRYLEPEYAERWYNWLKDICKSLGIDFRGCQAYMDGAWHE